MAHRGPDLVRGGHAVPHPEPARAEGDDHADRDDPRQGRGGYPSRHDQRREGDQAHVEQPVRQDRAGTQEETRGHRVRPPRGAAPFPVGGEREERDAPGEYPGEERVGRGRHPERGGGQDECGGDGAGDALGSGSAGRSGRLDETERPQRDQYRGYGRRAAEDEQGGCPAGASQAYPVQQGEQQHEARRMAPDVNGIAGQVVDEAREKGRWVGCCDRHGREVFVLAADRLREIVPRGEDCQRGRPRGGGGPGHEQEHPPGQERRKRGPEPDDRDQQRERREETRPRAQHPVPDEGLGTGQQRHVARGPQHRADKPERRDRRRPDGQCRHRSVPLPPGPAGRRRRVGGRGKPGLSGRCGLVSR